MSTLYTALTYLGIAVAGTCAALLIAGLIVLFDDWCDDMARRAADRRFP